MSWLALVNVDGPSGPVSGADARRAAEAELRRGEYHRDDPDLVSRALRWLGDRLDSVVNGTPSGSATLVLLVLLGAVIAFAVIRSGRPRRLARARAGRDPLAPDALTDHRRLAVQFEAQGQLAEALREWLRATVQTIEDRGILDPRPGRTGAAVAREAGALLPAVAGRLNAVVDAFDEVWFGRRPATPADLADARLVAESVADARLVADSVADARLMAESGHGVRGPIS